MGYQQLFQGVLMFPDKEAFEKALAVIKEGKECEDFEGERKTFRESMVSDRVMVLHYDIYQPATMWFETLGRLHVLAENAVRGCLVAVYWGDGIDVELIGTSLKPVPDRLEMAEQVKMEEDYFPMYEDARYDYESRFGGDISTLWWKVKEEVETSRGKFFSFPIEGGDFNYNDYLGGDQFLSKGNRLYVPAWQQTEGDINSLSDENFQLIADANSTPGTVWFTYITGMESMRIYKHLGYEDVAAAGEFYSACLKLQLNDRLLYTVAQDYQTKEGRNATFTDHISYLYFAKGVGLVKIGYPDGEIILKAFHRDGGAAPPPPLRPSQEATVQSEMRKKTAPKKPWWKLWGG
jgi:hypothetical protein